MLEIIKQEEINKEDLETTERLQATGYVIAAITGYAIVMGLAFCHVLGNVFDIELDLSGELPQDYPDYLV